MARNLKHLGPRVLPALQNPLICIFHHIHRIGDAELGITNCEPQNVCKITTEGKVPNKREEVCQQTWGCQTSKKAHQTSELWHLHIQSSPSSAPQHRYFQQGHEHHEQLRQWCFWENCRRSFTSFSLQQTCHHHQQGNPDRCPSHPARRAGQARRLWGNQGCHQVHQLSLILRSAISKQTALFRATTSIKELIFLMSFNTYSCWFLHFTFDYHVSCVKFWGE